MQSNETPVQPAQLVSRYYKLPFRKARHVSGQQVLCRLVIAKPTGSTYSGQESY